MSLFSNNKMAIPNYKITSRNSEELLGQVTDSEATFAKHIENLCRKANQKLGESSQLYDFKNAT